MKSPLVLLTIITALAVPGMGVAGEGESKDAAAKTGYKKGFFIEDGSGDFQLRIQGRLQARYEFTAVDGGADASAFSIPRARLTLAGKAFTKDLSYKFQTDFGKGFVSLKDFYIDYNVGAFVLRAGQFKRPFSRQQVNSSSRLELVDRAITDKYFGGGRDIGFILHNNYEKSPGFEYAVGLFNGNGDKAKFKGDVTVDPATGEGPVDGGKFTNVPSQFYPALALRVGYNHGGIKGYSEADLEGGGLRFAVGASAVTEFDFDTDDDGNFRAEADFMVKASGFAATGALYFASKQKGTDFDKQVYAAHGFHLQLSYLVAARYLPVLRYARTSPKGADNDAQEMLAGLGVFFFNHGLKWQTDAGVLVEEATGGATNDVQVRTQLQLSF